MIYCATLRHAPPRSATLRATTQRNGFLHSRIATLRYAARLHTARHSAPQRNAN